MRGVIRGVENRLVLVDPLVAQEVLRSNMRAAGIAPPPFPNAAHHIVAGTDPRAAPAREHMFDLCIGINEAINGVFLRYTDVGTGAYHPGLHTNRYHAEVEQRVLPTVTRADATFVLQGIADALRHDALPY